MIRLVAMACGLICGAGFLIAGFYDPALVHEVSERDPAPLAYGLALFAVFVASGLIASVSRKRGEPYLGGKDEPLPDWTGWKPLAHGLVFGFGWGLAGYFPLAALVSAGAMSPGAAIFLVSVLFGMILADVITGRRKLGGGQTGSFG